MFNHNVRVSFEKDKEKFKKRAEELGYVLFKDITYNDDFVRCQASVLPI